MRYLQLSYLIPKIIFFFLISSVLIGIHISLIEFAYAPNIIIASILLVYLSSNLQNAIFYIVVFSIIYGAISIEKIGWVLTKKHYIIQQYVNCFFINLNI